MPSAHSITPFIIDCFSLVGLFALARCAHNPFLQLKSKPNQRKDKFYSSFTNQSFSPSIKDNFLSLRKREERDWWGPLHKNLWFLITAAAPLQASRIPFTLLTGRAAQLVNSPSLHQSAHSEELIEREKGVEWAAAGLHARSFSAKLISLIPQKQTKKFIFIPSIY